jgi:hypothetical protein
MAVVLEHVSGPALGEHLAELARLRIQVFREYPYLYDGSEAYERSYLATYIRSGQAMAILAVDNERPTSERVVGASTGVPMMHETPEFKRPFVQAGIDPESLFYCGESVLLPQYRGRGLYRGFFAGREDYVRELGGFTAICFCAVVRPDDHPLRPAGYRPLDPIWERFGYQPRPDLLTSYSWKDIDQPTETRHRMMFWIKYL